MFQGSGILAERAAETYHGLFKASVGLKLTDAEWRKACFFKMFDSEGTKIDFG